MYRISPIYILFTHSAEIGAAIDIYSEKDKGTEITLRALDGGEHEYCDCR